MKVTVCFGDVRVLVPCGHGDLLVRDLVREATLRYKKATGKGPESWVVVRNLRSQTGGILDPDDRLQDVADDRETLVAALAGPSLPSLPPHPPHHHGGGDGASGSSVGTASPDIFRGGGGVGGSVRMDRKMEGADMCGVDVGAAELEGGTGGLQVRRGSEPTLNQDLLPHSQSQMSDHTKRWSAAVVGRDEVRLASPQKIHLSPDRHMENSHLIDSNKLHINSTNNHFQRQINRLSMQFSGPGSGIWLDAADRIPTNGTKSLPRESARKEPLGQDTNLVNGQNHRMEDTLTWVSGVNNNIRKSPIMERPLDMLPEVNGNEMSMEIPVGSGPVNFGHNNTNAHHKNGQMMTVDLVKGEKGLGFTITTRDNPTGGVCPIYIKNILPKGAAVVDGRLRAGDRLVAVAGRAIAGLTQQAVVAALRAAPTNSTVILVIERPSNNLIQAVQPQPSPPKFMDVKSTNSITITNKETNLNIVKPIVENGNRVNDMVNAINHNHNNSVRGRIKKSASRDDILNKELNDSDSALQDALNSSNTVLGLRNRMILRLDVPVHDSEKAGLGISVKGKVTVGPHPQDLGIFIKSVLHGGAASRDGRLHTNDQLLNVNGVSLVGQSNAEAMETLRRALVHTKSNIQGNISLTIARRTESMDSLSRWKDDTPPGVNESANSTNENISSNNSQSFSNQTVIYNSKISNKSADHTSGHQIKNHKSIVHLDSNYTPPNANSYYETAANDSNSSNNKKHSSVITINNNNSWISNQSDDNKALTDRDPGVPEKDNKRDSFEWGRLDGWNPVIDRLTSLRNESYYIATHTESPTSNGHREQPGRANHPASVYLGLRSPPQHNVILEEDYGSTKAPSTPGVWESESESVAGGDTGFSRTAIGRQSMSEKRHAALDARNTGTYKKLKEQRQNNGPQVGPALGMRKSSSLESLQTAIQEVSLHNKHNMLNMRRPDNFHSRAPLKHWLTDDHGGVDGMVRGSPQQSSLHHKKPSLLKSISTMFKIGKHKPKTLEASSEIYGRSQPMRSSEKSISKEALERIQHTSKLLQDERNNLESIRQNNHFKSGGTPEGNDRQWNAPPYRQPPLRTSPHTLSQVVDGGWGEHYSNYEEIQQNLNARREKLSEVQIGQMRRQVHAQRVKAEEETRRGPISKSASGHNLGNGGPGGNSGYHSQRGRSPPNARPQSNFYEYETVQRGRIRDPNININANTKLVQYR